MNHHFASPIARLFAVRTVRALGLGLVPLLAACAGRPSGETHWDEVTLRLGQSSYCDNAPCRVYLVMPPGSGEYAVSATDYGRLGVFPAGQTVFLGSFWEGRNTVVVEGIDAPPAWVWVGSAGFYF